MNREMVAGRPPPLDPPLTGYEWCWIVFIRAIGGGHSQRPTSATVLTLKAALEREAEAAKSSKP